MYHQINTYVFNNIPGVPALISASELLSSLNPQISGSFLHYAEALVENSMAINGSNSELESAYAQLAAVSQYSPHSNPQQLEFFADSLITAAEGSVALDLYELAYLAYACTSLYGPLSKRVSNKIQKVEPCLSQAVQFTSNNKNNNLNYNNYTNDANDYQNHQNNQNNTNNTFSNNYPNINNYNIQVSDNQNALPDFLNPQSNSSNSKSSVPVFMQDSSIQFDLDPNQQKALDLIELARIQFKQGSKEVAYSALVAAIKELQN